MKVRAFFLRLRISLKRLWQKITGKVPEYRICKLDRRDAGRGFTWALLDEENYLVSPEFKSESLLRAYVREKGGGFTYV